MTRAKTRRVTAAIVCLVAATSVATAMLPSAAATKVPGHGYAILGSTYAGYANRFIVMTKGSTATFHNYDLLARHDVTSSGGKFSSTTVGFNKSAQIVGVSSLAKGNYPFYCSLHRGTMKGTLIVQ